MDKKSERKLGDVLEKEAIGGPLVLSSRYPRFMPKLGIVLDELCYCGARKSEHGGIIGHGDCPRTQCVKFTWKSWVKGRAAWVAVLHNARGSILGLAVEGEQGYYPHPERGLFYKFDLAQAEADKLNGELRLRSEEVFRIVSSTMSKRQPPRRKRGQ